MSTTKPPAKKGGQDIAALKARLGVRGSPGAAVPGTSGAAAPGLSPRGAGGPVATVLPPGMGGPVEEDYNRPAAWAVDLTGALDPNAVEAQKGSGIGIKVVAVIAPALFFLFVGHWCGENNYGRRNHNDRIDEAEKLSARFGVTLDEVVKVDKSFKTHYAAMKEKGGKDFSEMTNFAGYLAGLRIETFMDDESISPRTPFMDAGLVTRLLVYYNDLAGFIALANHHGHLIAEHTDDLRRAHETAQGFKDALYAIRIPRAAKGGAPILDGSAPAPLGTAEIVWEDAVKKEKIKSWRFFAEPKGKAEDVERMFAAPVTPESKKAMLQPKNLDMLYEYNSRMGEMVKLLSKLAEEGRKILTGAENTLEKEKAGVRLIAF